MLGGGFVEIAISRKKLEQSLIYRIMNDSQESLAISIHETSIIKYCNVDETWWMELPKPPCL
jgi:hypothetical protein